MGKLDKLSYFMCVFHCKNETKCSRFLVFLAWITRKTPTNNISYMGLTLDDIQYHQRLSNNTIYHFKSNKVILHEIDRNINFVIKYKYVI